MLSLGSPERPGLHLHTSLPSLNVSFSNKVYNGIMGFVSGNLAEQSSFGAPRPPPPRKLNTVFNPDQAFSPRTGDPPSLRITVFVSKIQVLLMAQPSVWEKSPVSSAAPSPGTPNLKDSIDPKDVPFLRLGLENFTLNLFMLKQSGNLHIDLASGRLRIDDLRFASAAKWRRHKQKAERPNKQDGGRLPLVSFNTVEINGKQVFEAATVPVVHIVRAPWEPPKEEMLHITEKVSALTLYTLCAADGSPMLVVPVLVIHLPPNCRDFPSWMAAALLIQVESPNVMKIRFTMQKDGTMAAEVVVSQAVAQWPFLEDISLVNGILSILKRPPSEEQPPAVGQPTAKPWFYFNFLFQKVWPVVCFALPAAVPMKAKGCSCSYLAEMAAGCSPRLSPAPLSRANWSSRSSTSAKSRRQGQPTKCWACRGTATWLQSWSQSAAGSGATPRSQPWLPMPPRVST